MWFSTTYHYQKLLQYFLGSYNPDGTQTPDDHYLYTTNNKVAWQINQTSQMSYYFTLQRKVNGHRLGGSFADSKASNNNNSIRRCTRSSGRTRGRRVFSWMPQPATSS